MFIRTMTKIFIPAALFTLAACSPNQEGVENLGDPASIGAAPPAVTVTQGKGVTMQIELLKQTVELGEPVYLAIRVRNDRKVPVQIPGSLQLGMGTVKVFSSSEKGKKTYLAPLAVADFADAMDLAPGQTIGAVVPIFFGSGGWYFDKEGKYEISASITLAGKESMEEFSSASTTLSVMPSDAGKLLVQEKGPDSFEAGKFLLWRSGDHLQGGMKLLSKVAEKRPDSVLSAYIYAAMAQSYSEPFANYKENKLRAADCNKAAAFRAKVKPELLSRNIQIEEYIAEAKCAAETKSWKQAKLALDRGQKLASGAPEYMGYYNTILTMQRLLSKYL